MRVDIMEKSYLWDLYFYPLICWEGRLWKRNIVIFLYRYVRICSDFDFLFPLIFYEVLQRRIVASRNRTRMLIKIKWNIKMSLVLPWEYLCVIIINLLFMLNLNISIVPRWKTFTGLWLLIAWIISIAAPKKYCFMFR